MWSNTLEGCKWYSRYIFYARFQLRAGAKRNRTPHSFNSNIYSHLFTNGSSSFLRIDTILFECPLPRTTFYINFCLLLRNAHTFSLADVRVGFALTPEIPSNLFCSFWASAANLAIWSIPSIFGTYIFDRRGKRGGTKDQEDLFIIWHILAWRACALSSSMKQRDSGRIVEWKHSWMKE